MPLVIRDARSDDLEAISRLILAAFEEHMPAPQGDFSPGYRRAFEEYRRDIGDVRSRMGSSQLILAEDGGSIVGVVTLFPPHTSIQYPPGVTHRPWPAAWASFRLLAVDPARRGRGVGRALVTECVQRARALGASTLALHTSGLMEIARGLYERMGWVRAPEYDFRPGADVLVEAYVLPLPA
jgi:GNAT superfamily N-acetyltransferase